MKIYHYTKDFHLEKILTAKFVKVEDAGGMPNAPCFAWFTTEEYVPNTARPCLTDIYGKPNKYVEDVKFYRFVFDSLNPQLHPWKTYQKKVKGSKYKAILRRRTKVQKDNINKWFVSLEPVPIEYLSDGTPYYEEASLQPNAPSLLPVGAHS
ncbi:MAG: hypothetical protein VCB14_00835 [Alphaproteobacteria bacterium]